MTSPRKRQHDSDKTKPPKVESAPEKNQKQSKKQQKSVTPRGLSARCLSALKYILLIVIIPPFINYAALQREQAMLKPPKGELYDITWGQKLFLMCEGKGPPTVVLDAPTGMSSDVWSLIWPRIAKHSRVCVYDRAGLGFSERPYVNRSQMEDNSQTRDDWQPYTAERMVDDLYHLLTSSSQQPQPFILVGAELGALVSMFYTHMYEGSVFGLVLVNPLSEDLFEQDQGVWSSYWYGQLIPTYQSFQLGAALGVTRLALMVGLLKHPLAGVVNLEQEVQMRQKYLMCNPRHLSSVVDEHVFINETFSQMRTVRLIKPLPSNISVTLITGNYYDEQMPSQLNKAWAKSEQTLISRHLPYTKHIVVNGADHHMLYKDPEAVIDPVVKMIKQYKLRHKSQ